MLFLSDTFSKEAAILKRSSRSDKPITTTRSCPDDAFIDPTAYSILGMIILSIALRSKLRLVNKVTYLPVNTSPGISVFLKI